LDSAGGQARVVSLSQGIELRKLQASPAEGAANGAADPHTWLSPANVETWVDNAEGALRELDPDNADFYGANARGYRDSLEELDAWIEEEVSRIPRDDRKLVTDHLAFGYFADRYGFQQIGAVFPGFSSTAEPSAQEMAALQEAIEEAGVKAIFVGTTVNPRLAERLADETGINLETLYAGSLSEPGGPAETYLDLMRYDASTIVEALR